MSGPPDAYVDVAERIAQFYERYPDGRLTKGRKPHLISAESGRQFIVYHALAYRTPDDPLPGEGHAWEPLPGPTPFTRDSELMNAETAAWGRAIIAVGIPSKKIASLEEVQARSGTETTRPKPPGKSATPAQRRLIFAKAKDVGLDEGALRRLLSEVAGTEHTNQLGSAQVDDVLAAMNDLTPHEAAA